MVTLVSQVSILIVLVTSMGEVIRIAHAGFRYLARVRQKYIDILADTRLGEFLEISAKPYSIFWSVLFTMLVFTISIYGLVFVWTFVPETENE